MASRGRNGTAGLLLLLVALGACWQPAAGAGAARCSLTVQVPPSHEAARRVQVEGPLRVVLRVEALAPFGAPGEALRVVLPFYHAMRPSALPQGRWPERPGFTRLTKAPAGATLGFVDERLGPLMERQAPGFFEVRLGRPMAGGEVLEAVYGDGPAGRTRAQEMTAFPSVPGYKPFQCWRIDHSGQPAELLAMAAPELVPGPPFRLHVAAPSSVRPGEPFWATVAVRDAAGNVAGGFQGRVEVGCAGGAHLDAPAGPDGLRAVTQEAARVDGWDSGACLPVVAELGPAEGGSTRLEGLRMSRQGTFRLEARAWGAGERDASLFGVSNPIVARTTGPVVLFGDLHLHTGQVSPDAYGGLEDAFRSASETEGLDFAAKTDHDGELTAETWERTRATVKVWDRPGRFFAILGFEWNPAYSWGHRSVLFPALEGEVVHAGAEDGDTVEEMWKRVVRHSGLAIPHMPSAETVEHHHLDWSRHSDEIEPLVEIHSQWSAAKWLLTGQDSETNPRGVQAGLARGHRLGIVAGSDNHVATAGRTGGLAGVLARERSAAALWEALRQRRTCGTTGARTAVELHVDGVPQGGVSPVTTGPVRVEALVRPTGRIATVEILRGWTGAPVPFTVAHAETPPVTAEARIAWTDPSPLSQGFYYVRVHQSDGHRVWTSPVWVERRGGSPAPRAKTTGARGLRIPLPGPWQAATLESPPLAPPELTPRPGGFELRIPATRRPPSGEAFALFYSRVWGPPMDLDPAFTYRFRCRVLADYPATVTALLLNDELVNPGLFGSTRLLGLGLTETLERDFLPLAARTPASLTFFFSSGANRFQVDELELEQRR